VRAVVAVVIMHALHSAASRVAAPALRVAVQARESITTLTPRTGATKNKTGQRFRHEFGTWTTFWFVAESLDHHSW
jgi:hypothetical protein